MVTKVQEKYNNWNKPGVTEMGFFLIGILLWIIGVIDNPNYFKPFSLLPLALTPIIFLFEIKQLHFFSAFIITALLYAELLGVELELLSIITIILVLQLKIAFGQFKLALYLVATIIIETLIQTISVEKFYNISSTIIFIILIPSFIGFIRYLNKKNYLLNGCTRTFTLTANLANHLKIIREQIQDKNHPPSIFLNDLALSGDAISKSVYPNSDIKNRPKYYAQQLNNLGYRTTAHHQGQQLILDTFDSLLLESCLSGLVAQTITYGKKYSVAFISRLENGIYTFTFTAQFKTERKVLNLITNKLDKLFNARGGKISCHYQPAGTAVLQFTLPCTNHRLTTRG